MSDEFLKTLLAAKVPRVHTVEHQKKLKKLLLSQARFSKSQQGKLWERFTLFSDFKNMSFKKWIPATLLAVFVLVLVGQNYKASQNVAYAQSLIDETLAQIKTVSAPSDEEKILLSDLELLQSLQKSGQIIYLGEQINPADPVNEVREIRIHSFRFKGKDLSSQLLLRLIDGKELSLIFDPPGFLPETIEIKTDKEGNILNSAELKGKLHDPNLTQAELKSLVKALNRNFLNNNNPMRLDGFAVDEDDRELQAVRKKFYPQLQLLVEEATVPVMGLGTGYNFDTREVNFNLEIFALTGEEERKIQAKQEAQKMLDWLRQFDTPTAEHKRLLLKAALNSSELKSYSLPAPELSSLEVVLNFPYSIANTQEELSIHLPPNAKKEEDLLFIFNPKVSLVHHNKTAKEIKIWAKNGKLANTKELQEQLQGTPLNDESVSWVVQNHNQKFSESLYSFPESNPEINFEIVEELEKMVNSSPFLVTGVMLHFYSIPDKKDRDKQDEKNRDKWSAENRTNEKGELLIATLDIYSLGEVKKSTPDTQTLDKVVEEMRSSQDQGKEAKIQFLEELKQAKDLKYEGQVTLENGEKAEKISFSQNGQRVEVIFGGEGSEYEIVE